MRQILDTHALGHDVTDSELENAFLALVDRHRLPRPLLNRWLQIGTDWIRADALYPDRRVIVELDGRGSHDTTRAFHADRRRDRRLQALGWYVIRLTWRDIHLDEQAVADDLGVLLGR